MRRVHRLSAAIIAEFPLRPLPYRGTYASRWQSVIPWVAAVSALAHLASFVTTIGSPAPRAVG